MTDPLQEARRLSEAATPGPWVYRVSGDAVYLDAPLNGAVRCIAASIHSEQDEANYALMAAARELLPALAQRVEDAERALTKIRNATDQAIESGKATDLEAWIFDCAYQALRQEAE